MRNQKHALFIDYYDKMICKDNNGNWKTNNHKAINWLCTKIENSQTCLVIDIFDEVKK